MKFEFCWEIVVSFLSYIIDYVYKYELGVSRCFKNVLTVLTISLKLLKLLNNLNAPKVIKNVQSNYTVTILENDNKKEIDRLSFLTHKTQKKYETKPLSVDEMSQGLD